MNHNDEPFDQAAFDKRTQDPEFQRLVDATMRALDGPGGEEILDRMVAGQMSAADGLCALALMSGDYKPRV